MKAGWRGLFCVDLWVVLGGSVDGWMFVVCNRINLRFLLTAPTKAM